MNETEKLKDSVMFRLYYDGRHDKVTAVGAPGNGSQNVVDENHHTIVSQPDGNYCGFCCPENGTGEAIANALLQHLQAYSIDWNNVCVLGGDGTSSNAGSNDGSMAHIEITLCQSCQRVVYLLHHVELPFRKLFESLDGTTSGPKSFTGPMEKMALQNVWELPMTDFIPIFV